MPNYIKDPIKIEEESFKQIKALTDLTGFDELQKQVVMRLVHTCGNPEVASQVKISDAAIQAGITALENKKSVYCDVEMVKQGLTKRFLEVEPQCFLNNESIAEKAKANNESRTMTAIELWGDELKDGIAIIGNAPTALYRLLENIQQGKLRPSLIIGIPVGFIGAAESKQYLWEQHKELGIECITITGRTGGSALAAGAFNTLVRLQRGLRF